MGCIFDMTGQHAPSSNITKKIEKVSDEKNECAWKRVIMTNSASVTLALCFLFFYSHTAICLQFRVLRKIWPFRLKSVKFDPSKGVFLNNNTFLQWDTLRCLAKYWLRILYQPVISRLSFLFFSSCKVFPKKTFL